MGVAILPDLRWREALPRWREAEARGFATAWTYDHLSWRSLRDGPWLGAVPLLAAVAAVTSTLRIGTLVTSPNYRHPALLAKDVMTLDEVSAGRFDLGLGAGGTGYDADVLGDPPLSPGDRAARFEEFAAALDLLLREPVASHHGRFFHAVESRTLPGCTQRPRVPFTVAAAGPRALAVAAALGEAWVTFGPTTAHADPAAWFDGIAAQATRLDEACAAIDREPASVRRVVLVPLELGWAQESLAAWDDTVGRLASLGVTDVVVHWPRPDDPALPGPPPAVFDTISERLPTADSRAELPQPTLSAPLTTVAGVLLDVTRARRDTPGADRVVHLNNAGAALPPTQVTDAVVGHLRREAEIGGYEAAAEAIDRVENTYTAISRLLGCSRDEVAVVENATRAWDMAFYALPFAAGDRILTARAEYASNVIAFLQVARRTGAVVEVVDDDEHGQLSVADLRRRLADDRAGPARLVAMTHVPTHGGLVNPAEEVGAAAREAGVPFLLDACQSVGQLPVDVGRIGCDLLSATGRKFLRGPRGTGFLYVRREVLDQLEPPFLDLHAATWTAPDRYEMRADARRFENWETHVAGKIGLGVAIDYALSWGLDAIEARVTALADRMRVQLQGLDGVHVHDRGARRCGIVSFAVNGVPAQDVQRRLSDHGVNVSVSPVQYARFDLARRGLPDLVRASVHYYNTQDEIDLLLNTLPVPAG